MHTHSAQGVIQPHGSDLALVFLRATASRKTSLSRILSFSPQYTEVGLPDSCGHRLQFDPSRTFMFSTIS